MDLVDEDPWRMTTHTTKELLKEFEEPAQRLNSTPEELLRVGRALAIRALQICAGQAVSMHDVGPALCRSLGM